MPWKSLVFVRSPSSGPVLGTPPRRVPSSSGTRTRDPSTSSVPLGCPALLLGPLGPDGCPPRDPSPSGYPCPPRGGRPPAPALPLPCPLGVPSGCPALGVPCPSGAGCPPRVPCPCPRGALGLGARGARGPRVHRRRRPSRPTTPKHRAKNRVDLRVCVPGRRVVPSAPPSPRGTPGGYPPARRAGPAVVSRPPVVYGISSRLRSCELGFFPGNPL